VISRLKNLIYSAQSHQGFRRYFANTSWMFGEQMLRMIAGLLVGVWVARYLGPEQFGLFSYAIAFASLFGSIAKLGLDSIVVRDLVQEPAIRNAYMGTVFWLKFTGAFLMLAVVAFATLFTSNNSTTNLYVFIIASGFIFQSFEVIDFHFQSQVLSKFVSICKITQLITSSLIKLYLIFIDADLFWFVFVSLVDQASLAASLYIAYRYQKLGGFFKHFDFLIAKKLLNNSWPLIFSGLAITIYMRIDQVMIKEMLGEKEVGLYSAVIKLTEVWYFIPVLITSSLFPAIVNAKKTNTSLYYSRLKNLYDLMVLLALTLAIPTTFLSGFIITLIYGSAYKEAASVLAVNFWACLFVFLGVVNARFLLVEAMNKIMLYMTVTCATLNIIFNLIFIPKYGVVGASIATLLAQFFGLFFNYLYRPARVSFYMQIKALMLLSFFKGYSR
jgi:O-antigen/teichoic acid export membrane protein